MNLCPLHTMRGAAALLAALLTLHNVSGAPAAYHIHNPTQVNVTEIHLVVSSHFDAGCKTPGCGKLLPGEPNLCAKVGAGNAHGATDPFGTGEPYAYHIINRYLDQFLPKAIEYAEQSRGTDSPYSYMTQAWLVSLYLHCENNGLASWEGAGYSPVGRSLLHCPNASSVKRLKEAMKQGQIFVHGFPHDGQASYYPDASLFSSALMLARDIADEVGVSPPVAVSQRDVPGAHRQMN